MSLLIPDTALPKIIALAAMGQVDEAFRVTRYMVARDAPAEPIRQQIRDACIPSVGQAIVDALPWLAGEKFNARPAKSKDGGNPSRTLDDLRAMLDEANWRGLPRTGFSDEEFEALKGETRTVDVRTGGRPRVMVRLKVHDVRETGWATQGDY